MPERQPPKLIIVVPCYNEEEVLRETAARLGAVLQAMARDALVAPQSCVLFVDDGSRDATWAVVEALHAQDAVFTGISFAANRGHQNAVMAGLMEARGRCDAAISIDADLQDDVNAIPQMVRAYLAGAQIVYGVRKARDTDTFFKRFTARGFYTLMRLMGVKTVYDHADYRLLGAEALDALSEYQEANLFLRGLVPMLGYQTATVYYDRAKRFAGESKYPLRKMLHFAVDGITSCSDVPIRLIGAAGMALCAAAALWGLVAIVLAIVGRPVGAAAAVIIVLLLLTGLVLCALGILGTYIGKTYIQVKRRPRYRVARRLP
ncbi:MAG: glycosyltransferase family 2 protein [Oscillospiraceae bacterium]|jgi:glycosyltransferase involved in cell wall biosynthesis|nr:glycosyltransferase family 2 protein [Oscillospiraceae bacterium]